MKKTAIALMTLASFGATLAVAAPQADTSAQTDTKTKKTKKAKHSKHKKAVDAAPATK